MQNIPVFFRKMSPSFFITYYLKNWAWYTIKREFLSGFGSAAGSKHTASYILSFPQQWVSFHYHWLDHILEGLEVFNPHCPLSLGFIKQNLILRSWGSLKSEVSLNIHRTSTQSVNLKHIHGQNVFICTWKMDKETLLWPSN